MTVPVFRRFSQADVPTAPNWLGTIFSPLNVFCEQTVQLFNKGLVIGQNVQGMKFSTVYTAPFSYLSSNVFTPITFQYTGGGQPNCCMIGNISRVDGLPIQVAVGITSWLLNQNTNPYTVTINFIAGLSDNIKYNITFVVL